MWINTHSSFSLKYGIVPEGEIIELAKEKNIQHLALTDINNTSALLGFIQKAQKSNISPCVGIDFRNQNQTQFIGIAKNNIGFYELNQFLSHHLHNNLDFPETAPIFENVFIIYPYEVYKGQSSHDYEFIGIRPNQLTQYKYSKHLIPHQKTLALVSCTFRNSQDFNTHRLLRSIENNCLLSKLPKEQEGKKTDLFYSKEEIETIYQDHNYLLENSIELLKKCSIYFDFSPSKKPINQQNYTENTQEDIDLIRKLAYDGISYRYQNSSQTIIDRIEKELSIIQEKKFISYFLINWDILKYARSKNYFYVGRGSGANSLVAYLLRITDVDPIELDLYFERFINLYRQSPPDFDIDFSWTDREDVTQYIFSRFKNTTLLATYNTFQINAAIRELGKVFGLPKHEIDKLSKTDFDTTKQDQIGTLIKKYSVLIKGLPNHLSIHAGGILISEKPIWHYSATFMPPKGFATSQFDMVIAEDIGLFKFDILSQRGLGKIKDTISLVEQNQPTIPPLPIHNIPLIKNDPKVISLLKNANAIACFYIESPAMRMLLKKLETDNYLGLVAASSIIRPGVAKSGMMQEYIRRYRDPERRKRVNKILWDIMPETYGVMVYQEDVIKVAHYFAHLTLAEADVLRRGMSGKYRGRQEFLDIKDKFFSNCAKLQHKPVLIENIWKQIESFAGYAFAKGHSASYAVESFQALYLKAHFPLEYMVATINNGGGFYSPEIYLHEAKMCGATIHSPCINTSKKQTIILLSNIYLGFNFIKDLDNKTITQIIRERELNGHYIDFEDFLNRINIGIEQTRILIRTNAFRFTLQNKQELLWQANFYFQKKNNKSFEKPLFPIQYKKFKIPTLDQNAFENAFDEMEFLGFPLCSPFDLVKSKDILPTTQKEFKENINKTILIDGYYIIAKRTRTSKGEIMNFGTFIDRDGEFIDTVHFPQIAYKYPFKGIGVYRIEGKVVEEFSFLSIEVQKMTKLPYIEDQRYFTS